jgi:hypothetical protein
MGVGYVWIIFEKYGSRFILGTWSMGMCYDGRIKSTPQ